MDQMCVILFFLSCKRENLFAFTPNVLLQSFPTTWKDSLETFHQATARPYGYLVLDIHPASSDQQRLLSHLLKDEGWTRTYQKRRSDQDVK